MTTHIKIIKEASLPPSPFQVDFDYDGLTEGESLELLIWFYQGAEPLAMIDLNQVCHDFMDTIASYVTPGDPNYSQLDINDELARANSLSKLLHQLSDSIDSRLMILDKVSKAAPANLTEN